MQCRPACPPFIVCYDIQAFPLIHLLRPTSSFSSLLMKTQYEVDVPPASFTSSGMRPANALLYMTSRPPCWCFKTIKRRPCWTFSYVETFFCSEKLAWRLSTGEKTLCWLYFPLRAYEHLCSFLCRAPRPLLIAPGISRGRRASECLNKCTLI